MLKVKDINKFYNKKQILHNLNFEIEKGHAVGFVGPNGAGKSTTMNIITGYLEPTSGMVEIDGVNQQTDLLTYKSKFGYLPEVPPLYMDMIVQDYLEFVFEAKKIKGNKKQEVARVMEKMLLTNVKGRLIKHLSKGYKQRIGFAQALLGNPPVLVLDEPTIGLDPGQIIEVRNLLLDLKKEHTIFISSHILSEITEVCDKIIFIHEGTLMAYGNPHDLMMEYCSSRRCEFAADGCSEECIRKISSLPGMKSCKKQSEKDGISVYLAEYEKEYDARKDIASILAQCGAGIYEIKEIQDSLEDVFLKLVKK